MDRATTQGDHIRAPDFYDEALAQYRKTHDRRGEAKVLQNTGVLYAGTGDLAKALSYYEQALAIAREVGDPEVQANGLNYIALIHRGRGEPEKALEYHEQALSIAREAGYSHGEASILSNIGLLYATQGKPDKALPMLVEARLKFLGIGAQLSAENPTQNLKLLLQQTGRESFVKGCVEAGMTSEDAEELAEADLRRDRPMAD